jgi:hypothetical protein
VKAPVVSAPTLYYFGVRAMLGDGSRAQSPVVSVLINPAPTPTFSLSSNTFNLTCAAGGPPPPDFRIFFQNFGMGTLNWTAVSNQPWLKVTPSSGALVSDGHQPTVSCDPTGLAPGVYQGTITFSDPAAANSPQTVFVTLTVVSIAWVTPPPATCVSGQTFSFTWNCSADTTDSK